MFKMGAKLEQDSLNIQGSKAKKAKKDCKQKGQGKAKEEKFDNKILVKKEHILHIKIEKRRAKTISLIGKFYLLEKEKKELLTMLRKTLASGGSIQNNYIELQGDFRVLAKELLKKDAWKFKS